MISTLNNGSESKMTDRPLHSRRKKEPPLGFCKSPLHIIQSILFLNAVQMPVSNRFKGISRGLLGRWRLRSFRGVRGIEVGDVLVKGQTRLARHHALRSQLGSVITISHVAYPLMCLTYPVQTPQAPCSPSAAADGPQRS